jgi:NhaA family Na+:H+ antiporter
MRSWWLLLPLAALTWVLVHEAGIHPTVAGALLAFTVPVLRSEAAGGPDAGPGLAEHFEHRLRPISAAIAVPIFAFLSAGVAVGGLDGLSSAARDPVAIGVVVGLVIGKPLGVFGSTAVLSRFTGARLDDELGWWDVAGLALLAGVGFTVSLLIGELAFGPESAHDAHAKIGILVGSLASIGSAAVVLRARARKSRRRPGDVQA